MERMRPLIEREARIKVEQFEEVLGEMIRDLPAGNRHSSPAPAA
jgi:hypothetical protein